ncbi:MAG: hypothetical protein ABJM29_14135 [Rhizobiaceae bacterium]
MLQHLPAEASLDNVQAVIDGESMLYHSIVDVQLYEDTLVIFTVHETPVSFVRLLLRDVWRGPIEVYCSTALLAGSEMSIS